MPPEACLAFFGRGREPVLPENRAHLMRRLLPKRIPREKRKHIRVGRKQSYLGVNYDGILAPGSERSEPQVPIKTWLIGRVNARRLARVLRFIAKRIWLPVLSVLRSLELDLVATASHDGKKAISIGDAKRFQRLDRRSWQFQGGEDDPDQFHCGRVKDPTEHNGDQRALQHRQLLPEEVPPIFFSAILESTRFRGLIGNLSPRGGGISFCWGRCGGSCHVGTIHGGVIQWGLFPSLRETVPQHAV